MKAPPAEIWGTSLYCPDNPSDTSLIGYHNYDRSSDGWWNTTYSKVLSEGCYEDMLELAESLEELFNVRNLNRDIEIPSFNIHYGVRGTRIHYHRNPRKSQLVTVFGGSNTDNEVLAEGTLREMETVAESVETIFHRKFFDYLIDCDLPVDKYINIMFLVGSIEEDKLELVGYKKTSGVHDYKFVSVIDKGSYQEMSELGGKIEQDLRIQYAGYRDPAPPRRGSGPIEQMLYVVFGYSGRKNKK